MSSLRSCDMSGAPVKDVYPDLLLLMWECVWPLWTLPCYSWCYSQKH